MSTVSELEDTRTEKNRLREELSRCQQIIQDLVVSNRSLSAPNKTLASHIKALTTENVWLKCENDNTSAKFPNERKISAAEQCLDLFKKFSEKEGKKAVAVIIGYLEGTSDKETKTKTLSLHGN